MGMNIRVKRYTDGAAFRQRRRERNVWCADVEAERGEDFLFMARTDFVCGGKLLREGFFSVRILLGERRGFYLTGSTTRRAPESERREREPSTQRIPRNGAVHLNTSWVFRDVWRARLMFNTPPMVKK